MARSLRLSFLIPAGLVTENWAESGDGIVVRAHAEAVERCCPLCGNRSRRVHSRYVRKVSDLPTAGRAIVHTRAQAEQAIARYVDGFHHPVRRHSALDFVSPVQFERLPAN